MARFGRFQTLFALGMAVLALGIVAVPQAAAAAHGLAAASINRL